ncbi:MAG: hypothetical protein V1708_01685 [Candidatus Micrarchaeota archaeon]
MVEIALVLQGIAGGALFFATGYLLSLWLLKDEGTDPVERAVYSIAFSILIPATVAFALNYGLGLKVFNTISIYAIYLGLCALSIYFGAQKGRKLKLPNPAALFRRQ